MMSETSPHNLLPGTLAERIRFFREQRLLTVPALAQRAYMPIKMIEDIEAGIELFLSPAIRARLARILHVNLTDISEVEKPPSADIAADQFHSESITLHQAILIDPEAEHHCPQCAALLKVRVFERRDFHDKPLIVIKVHCSQCLFRLTDD